MSIILRLISLKNNPFKPQGLFPKVVRPHSLCISRSIIVTQDSQLVGTGLEATVASLCVNKS